MGRWGDGAMEQLPQTVAECHTVIAQLIERVKLLEERIRLDSSNSSKPPSSDGPGRPNRAQRRASQRKRGAQPGHKGHSRAMPDEGEVGRLVDCKPAPVCECGDQVEVADQPRRHQVFEVPPMRAQVDEYRLYSGRCAACGKPHSGELPPGVPKGQLGPRALSLVGVLGTRYHLTQRKIRNLLDQLMGLSFSVGGDLAGAWQGRLRAQDAGGPRRWSRCGAPMPCGWTRRTTRAGASATGSGRLCSRCWLRISAIPDTRFSVIADSVSS